MEHDFFTAGAYTAKVYRCNTAVVGSGAAGFNAADRLWQLGQHDIVLVTENRAGGTSRNTGSDKQTYYKLTLSGGEPDSVREMAQTLYEGKCVDGDIALCEAALSTQCFLKLVDLGVPFPRNRYGEYIGYKTAHGGKSRGSALYTDLTGGTKPFGQLPDTFTFAFDETESPLIQELWFEDGTCRTAWRAPRPIPEDDDFFENVWRSYRETGNID